MIRTIRYSDILDAPNASRLIEDYSAECSIPEIGETNPQRELYSAMEATGLMQDFGAFHDDLLVGFASILIYVLPHYGAKIATVESLFVDRSYRRFGYGSQLKATVRQFARERNCVVILYSAPVGSQLEKLLSLQSSCRRTNSVFCERLA